MKLIRSIFVALIAAALAHAAAAQPISPQRSITNPLPGLTGLGQNALPGLVSNATTSRSLSMTAIWNGSDKDSTFATPAGTKRLAQYVNAGATVGNMRSTSAITGRVCFAITPGLLPGADNMTMGVANGTAGLTTGMGSDNNSIAVFARQGIIFLNSATLATLASTGLVGNEFTICVDVPARLFWASVDGGLWNNSSSANPSTGGGGFDISVLGSPIYLAVGMNNAHSVTFVLAAPTAIAVPAGFTLP